MKAKESSRKTFILPKRLEEKIRQKAEEAGEFTEQLLVELLQQSLKEELDPEEVVEHYEALCDYYYQDAKELLSQRNRVQASEKLWGAAALTLKAVAAKRGLKLEKHGSLWSFLNMLAQESKDKEFIRLFNAANALHKNFYEDEMPMEAVEVSTEDIERLIAKLKGILRE
jgi:hypothetical protein